MDYDAPSSKLVIPLMTNPGIRVRLLRIAYWSTRSITDAEDLVSDACVRTLDPEDRPWNPQDRPYLLHMAHLMRQIWDQIRRRLSFEREIADGAVAQETAAGIGESPEEALDRSRTLDVQRQMGELVLAGLVGRAREVFELRMEHDLTLSEQAERLNCSRNEIKAAHEQIAYRAQIVMIEWEAAKK